MPYAPDKPCATPGCPHLVPRGTAHCEQHEAQRAKEGRGRWSGNRKDDRPSAHRRGYGRRWTATRKGFLAKHPRCWRCGATATVVDHIVPHRGNMDLFWNRDNWQPLCSSCHSRKTASEDRVRDPR